MKSLTQLKKDYFYILRPLLSLPKEEAEKRLTTLEKRVERTIWEKEAKLEVIRELKRENRNRE